MGPIIVDTSVWVDCFRGLQNDQTRKVADLLVHTKRITITPTILQEVLQGIRDNAQFARIRTSLLACILLTVDPVEAAIGAADLYRTLRKIGVTIRKPNDCLIAYYAIFHNIPVLQNDIDFIHIAQHTPLQLITDD
ncbi:type II toxin-antitoxin system VapC family toxin [Spirosoma jeollabukense]